MKLVHPQNVRLNHDMIVMVVIMWIYDLALLTPWKSYPGRNTIILHITFLFRNLSMFPKLHYGFLCPHCYSFPYMDHGCILS